MADLFTRGELASYLQIPEVDDETVDLLLELVTAQIRLYAGPAVYDAMSDTDLLALKGIALEAAKRCYLNPSGLRQQSSAIDDYQESQTFATETFGGVGLTESEQGLIDRVLGRSTAAFTIRAVAEPFRSPRRHPGLHPDLYCY